MSRASADRCHVGPPGEVPHDVVSAPPAHLDTTHLGPARGSGVLVRDDRGAWKIAQYNLSIPIPNERFKEVKALIESQPDGGAR